MRRKPPAARVPTTRTKKTMTRTTRRSKRRVVDDDGLGDPDRGQEERCSPRSRDCSRLRWRRMPRLQRLRPGRRGG